MERKRTQRPPRGYEEGALKRVPGFGFSYLRDREGGTRRVAVHEGMAL